MQKTTLLLLLLALFQNSISGQGLNISHRFHTVGTPKNAEVSEVLELTGKYDDVDFRNAAHPVLRNSNDLIHKKLYRNKQLYQLSTFKQSAPEYVLARFDFEYDGEQLQRIKCLSLQLNHKTHSYELQPYQTLEASYQDGQLVRETVHSAAGKLLEQYDYKASADFQDFPLIEYTHFNFDPKALVKETRNTLQYANDGIVFYYAVSGADTVYSIERHWISPDTYVSHIYDGETKTVTEVKNYWDIIGNQTLSVIQEKGSAEKTVGYRKIKYLAGTIDYSAAETLAAERAAVQTTAPVIPDAAAEIEEDTPSTPTPTDDSQRVYQHFELSKKPVFQENDQDGLRFLAANIKYPEAAKKNGLTGMVYVSFIIEKDGSLSNIEVKKDIGGGCGAEVVRVLKSMPNWTPAQLNNKPVRASMVNPFKFKL